MLVERLERDDVPVWLVNTGWTGGPYGTGERMNIAHTRSMVRAALDGSLGRVPTRLDPNFGVEVPLSCPDVPASFLDPRATWADPEAYDRAAVEAGRDVPGQLRGLRRTAWMPPSPRPARGTTPAERRLPRLIRGPVRRRPSRRAGRRGPGGRDDRPRSAR